MPARFSTVVLCLLTFGCDTPTPELDAGPADAGSPCGISTGLWELTGAVLPTSTRIDCVERRDEVPGIASIDQMAGLGTCMVDCTCSDTPATEPECTATRVAVCMDGTQVTFVYQKTSETTATGMVRSESGAGGLFCEFEVAGRWLR